MRASLCRCGNRMVQDCFRVDVHLESTISTNYPFPQFSRGFGIAKMMSCRWELAKCRQGCRSQKQDAGRGVQLSIFK